VGKDYYTLLSVRREATPAEIRRGYETALARASRDGATRHMVDLLKAYEVLSHPGRRSVYDRTGFGVVPERVPNTYGRQVPFRGGHLGLAARRRSAVTAPDVLPAARRGPSGPYLVALSLLAITAVSLAVAVIAAR
jgi:curved DNA-binding protein CbpA